MNLSSKKVTYFLMVFLIFSWGFEYIMAKAALELYKPVTLIFLRYCIGCLLLLGIKLIRDRHFHMRKQDILFFFICSIFGDIIYFGSEYTALSYLPVSIVTLVLSMVPTVSIVVEVFLYKRKPTVAIVIGCLLSVFGVALIVGADFGELLEGKLIGYLLILGALISWNVYNFMTAHLTKYYNSFDLTLYQIAAAILVSAPYALFNMPEASLVTPTILASVLYLGIVSAGICFLIYVHAIAVIGVTPAALFANMLPVTSTLMGWLFLGEMIQPIQIVGGVIVILAGCVVIYLKDKSDNKQVKINDSTN